MNYLGFHFSSLLLYSYIFNPFDSLGLYMAFIGFLFTDSDWETRINIACTCSKCSQFCHAFCIFYFFFFSTGVWTLALHLEPLHHPFFVLGFLRYGLTNYLPGAGFEPPSFWFLPPEELGYRCEPPVPGSFYILDILSVFFDGTEFHLTVLCLLGRCSTTGATPWAGCDSCIFDFQLLF
jgi:hypothetical protein